MQENKYSDNKMEWVRCERCHHKLFKAKWTCIPPLFDDDYYKNAVEIEIKCSSCGKINELQY